VSVKTVPQKKDLVCLPNAFSRQANSNFVATEKYSALECGKKGEDRRKLVSIIGMVGLGFALIAYGLRMFAKSKTGFGADDYAITVAMVSFP
jgi:hypothetical protein